MQLLVVRHAIAMEREEFAASGRPDSERPLTDRGRARMWRNARGLREVVPRIDVIGTSPWVRAADTARILSEVLGISTVETVGALTPDHRPDALLAWIESHGAANGLAVVGHEPHLGTLITWLVSGRTSARVELKKGGACLLDLGARPAGGEALLRWLLTPSQLRALA